MIQIKVWTLTRNKHHVHKLIANLSCFQKGASYSGIGIFNNLPQSITSLRNEKPRFKVAQNFFYVHTTLALMDEIFAFIDDCVNSYTVIILYVLYAFVCFWRVPPPIVWWQAWGIYGMYVCMHVCMYVCMHVCMYVGMYAARSFYSCVLINHSVTSCFSHGSFYSSWV